MENFRLKVGPVVYEVSEIEGLRAAEGSKIDGEILHGSQRVSVEQGLPRRSQEVTVVHELLHAILQQAGHYKWYKNEGLLDALAYGLVGTQVNPGPVTQKGQDVMSGLFDAMEHGDNA